MGQSQLGAVKVSLRQERQPDRARAFPQGGGRDSFGLGDQVIGPQRRQHAGVRQHDLGGILNTEFWIPPGDGHRRRADDAISAFYDAEAIEVLNGFEQRVYMGPR